MPRINDTREKISNFKNLPVGWNFREGIPPSDNVIKSAQLLNSTMKAAKFLSTDAFPGVGGQIQVNAYSENIYLEFMIENEHEIFFTLELENELIFEVVSVDIFQAVSAIFFWGAKLWDTSESLISATLISQKEDLQVPLSISYKVESPLSTQNVLKKQGVTSVSTLKNGTQTLVDRRPSTFGFLTNSYQLIPT